MGERMTQTRVSIFALLMSPPALRERQFSRLIASFAYPAIQGENNLEVLGLKKTVKRVVYF